MQHLRHIAFATRGTLVVLVMAIVSLAPAAARAQLAEGLPAELEGMGIDDKPGAELPKDVVLKDAAGKPVALGSFFDGTRPTVLTLAYYSCPMLCTLVLNAVNNGLKDVAWNMGNEYRVVTISIDPRDTPEIAGEKQANYLRDYGRAAGSDAWTFLTGDEASVRKVADAIGFKYRWDEPTQQYVHAAAAFVLTPDGKVSRTLYGIEFPGRDLRLALVEASGGKIATAVDRLLLFCFHYDPQARGYVLAATRVMRAGGVLTALLLVLWLLRLWRGERPRPLTPLET